MNESLKAMDMEVNAENKEKMKQMMDMGNIAMKAAKIVGGAPE